MGWQSYAMGNYSLFSYQRIQDNDSNLFYVRLFADILYELQLKTYKSAKTSTK
jgi:hypothetical protein